MVTLEFVHIFMLANSLVFAHIVDGVPKWDEQTLGIYISKLKKRQNLPSTFDYGLKLLRSKRSFWSQA